MITGALRAAGVPQARTCVSTGLALIALLTAATPAAAVTQSWNGYRWSRTGPLAIQIGNNVTSQWTSLFTSTAAVWSLANNIDFVTTAGRATSSACGAVYGTVQVCNSKYGFNGWLGYTNVWLANGFIVQATVRLNDSYFASAKYNNAAWRMATICQEMGHTLGLDHTNVVRTNPNTGSCMDYTNDPSGTAGGVNGTLANTGPNAVDFAALDGIYANLDTTQLASTKPTIRIGSGWWISGEGIDSIAFVPEPGTWALFIAGFGAIGGTLRRRRGLAAA
jgi:hypothetical protein